MDDFKVRSWIFYILVTLLSCSVMPITLLFFIDTGSNFDLGFWLKFWIYIERDFYIFIAVIPASIFFNNLHNYFKSKPLSFVPNKSLGAYIYAAYFISTFLIYMDDDELWVLCFFLPLYPLIPYYFISFYYAPDKIRD